MDLGILLIQSLNAFQYVWRSPWVRALVFLLAAVIAVPVFKRFGLGAVLAYLVAGVVLSLAVLIVGAGLVSLLALFSHPADGFRVVGAGAGHGLALGATAGGAILGDIGQKREQGEAVRQTGRLIHRHGGQQLLQALGGMGRRVAVIGDGGLPHRFDLIEQGLAALGALTVDDFASITLVDSETVTGSEVAA